MISKTTLLVAAAAFVLTGCSTMSPIVNRGGIRASDKDQGQVGLFYKAATKAYEVASTEGAGEDPASRLMVKRGFELINISCQDYFRSAGRDQTILNFGRDATVAATAFGVAAAGLNPRNNKVLRAVPIATAGLYSAFDVYNKDFLFSAENIDSVSTLITKALGVHQAAVNSDLIGATLTYGGGLDILEADQAICMPPKIRSLVSKAIKSGDVVAVGPSSPNGQANVQDAGVVADIGVELKAATKITLDQAAAYFWFFTDSTTADDNIKIRDLLKDLPEDALPVDAKGAPKGSAATPWPHAAQLRVAVGRLSSGTQANIFRSIAGYRAQVIDKTNATAAAAAPGFSALPAADQAAIQKRASAKPTFPSVGSSSGGVQGVDIKGE